VNTMSATTFPTFALSDIAHSTIAIFVPATVVQSKSTVVPLDTAALQPVAPMSVTVPTPLQGSATV